MKKLIVLLMIFTLFLSSCQSADTGTAGSSSSKPEITKKQYLTHKETEVFDWKCDIPSAKIKFYDGSPIQGFFITLEDELYEYNAEEIFPQTEKNYRKIDTDFKILYMDYHFQLNELSVVTDDYKTYIYDKENDSFVYTNPEFTSVVQKFAKSDEIIKFLSFIFDINFEESFDILVSSDNFDLFLSTIEVSGYPANPCITYMTIANTDKVVRPAFAAPSDMISADTTPPTNGGIATITVLTPNSKVPIVNNATIIPKIPASEINILFHCSFNCLRERSVPIFVMRR